MKYHLLHVARHLLTISLTLLLLNNPVSVLSTISITSTGVSRSGEEYTLTCLSSSSSIVWKKGAVTVVTGSDVTVSVVSTDGSTSERSLTFDPLRVANGGVYTCEGGSESTTETITVIVPTFVTALLRPLVLKPYYAATMRDISCSLILGGVLDDPGISGSITYFRNNDPIVEGSRITFTASNLLKTSAQFTGSLTFGYMTISDDAVYACEGFLFSTEEYVTNGSSLASNDLEVAITVPSINITLVAESYRILAHEDYNTLSLSCSDALPSDLDELEFDKEYTWLLNDTDYTSSAVGPSKPDKRESMGSLSLPINNIGVVMVTCIVSIQVPGDPVISSNESINVTIQGPTLPESPTNLRSSSISNELSSFIVYWTVPSIAYTPERYTVRYGTNQLHLTNTSATINGSTNLTAVDIEYSLKLTNLNFNTLYYFTVIANNTEGGASSVDTGNFTTLRIKVPNEPPRNFTISQTSSDSVTLRWSPVRQEARNDPITSYTVSCNSTESLTIVQPIPTVEDSQGESLGYSIIVTNLNAYTIYLCTLYANNSGGAGPVTTATIRTPEDIPGEPVNVSLVGSSSSSITIRWSKPSMANGIIVLYTVYMNLHNGSTAFREVSGDKMEYVVTDLMPYQRVSASVSASTSQGEGSRSLTSSGRSLEAAPRSINDVRYIVISESRLKVNFTQPSNEIARGEILYYSVVVREYGVDVVRQNATIPGNSLVLEAFISGLEGEIPYRVSVFAINSAGTGDTTSKLLFTKEGISPPPSSVILERLNGTHMRVTWEPIPLTLAKGFITQYSVSYSRVTTPTSSNTKRQSGLIVVPSNQTSIIIGELTPSARYSVSVSAANSAGPGIESVPQELGEVQPDSNDEGIFTIMNIVIVVCCVLGLIILVVFIVLVLLVVKRRNRPSKQNPEELPQGLNVVVPAHIPTGPSMAYGQLPGTPEPMLDSNHPLGKTHIVAHNPTYTRTPEPFEQPPTYNYAYAKPDSNGHSYEKPSGPQHNQTFTRTPEPFEQPPTYNYAYTKHDTTGHAHEKQSGPEHMYECIDNLNLGKEPPSYDVPKPQLPAPRPSMSNGSNHITKPTTDQQ